MRKKGDWNLQPVAGIGREEHTAEHQHTAQHALLCHLSSVGRRRIVESGNNPVMESGCPGIGMKGICGTLGTRLLLIHRIRIQLFGHGRTVAHLGGASTRSSRPSALPLPQGTEVDMARSQQMTATLWMNRHPPRTAHKGGGNRKEFRWC